MDRTASIWHIAGVHLRGRICDLLFVRASDTRASANVNSIFISSIPKCICTLKQLHTRLRHSHLRWNFRGNVYIARECHFVRASNVLDDDWAWATVNSGKVQPWYRIKTLPRITKKVVFYFNGKFQFDVKLYR